ncbi:non-specific phospholipase C6 [Dendrobium catenatum]|uniref:non-specific phospholipase C6 n=1 Tax=Dendrobium catenatum TaxID=906689 RepID=UPI0010A0786F|nr:non-specific phospholipase C6 [Dendrobium catenatum]
MLGYLKQSLNPSINGLTGAECNPLSASSSSICVSDDAGFVESDPGHSFQAVVQQIFGSSAIPSMSGFAQQASTVSSSLPLTVMQCFDPQTLPVFSTLVDDFAVFDRWFSSIPGPTQPNRLFLYSATSHGATTHDPLELLTGYPQKTIFDSLHENLHDFAVYFSTLPTTLFYARMRKLEYASKFHWFSAFGAHAKAGKLAKLSVIEPRYFDLVGAEANDDHPAHDVGNGQRLVKEVYEMLRGSPQWNESLLIVSYDEHGGFYDHVETPYVGVPNPDGMRGPAPFLFDFDRLGVRVPTIMVSPWIKKGTVVSRPNGPTANSEYEHSSIPATLKKIFGLKSEFLTKRDAWAGTFEHIFEELSSPRTDCPEILPSPFPTRSSTEIKEDSFLSEFQAELVDLASVLNGDSIFNLHRETDKKMTVKEADAYVKSAIKNYLKASKEAIH